MTQNQGSKACKYSDADGDIVKNLKLLLNYLCKNDDIDSSKDNFSDIFGENTITLKESSSRQKNNDKEKSQNINIFTDGVFISHVTNPLDIESFEKSNILDCLTQMAIYARITAGIKCCDGKYIDLEGLRAAFTMFGLNFYSDNSSIIDEKLYKIKILDTENFKSSEI